MAGGGGGGGGGGTGGGGAGNGRHHGGMQKSCLHNGGSGSGTGSTLRTSTDSMRTLTTSLTLANKRSSTGAVRPAHVVITEPPKVMVAMSTV